MLWVRFVPPCRVANLWKNAISVRPRILSEVAKRGRSMAGRRMKPPALVSMPGLMQPNRLHPKKFLPTRMLWVLHTAMRHGRNLSGGGRCTAGCYNN